VRRFLNMPVFFLLLSATALLHAQDPRMDSLRLELSNAKTDSAKTWIRFEIGEYGQIFRVGYWDSLGAFIKQVLDNKKTPSKLSPSLHNFFLTHYGLCMNNIGFIYNQQGNIQRAIDYGQLSRKVQEETNDQPGLATSYTNLAHLYFNQGEEEKALEYYMKSLSIREKINDKKDLPFSLSNIGSYYEKKGNMEKALDYYQRCKIIQEELKDNRGLTLTLIHIGHALALLNKTSEAQNYFQNALNLSEKIQYNRGITGALTELGELYCEQGRTATATAYGKRALKLSQELGIPVLIRTAAHLLSRTYKKQNNFREALEMQELYIKMRDSIANGETKKASIKSQLKYDYEKKAAADSVQNAEAQKVKDAQLSAQSAKLKQEKTQFWFLVCGLLFVVCGLTFVVNRFRITQKQKKIIEAQKLQVDEAFEKLHEKNKEVLDSIYYARRIQRALITQEGYIEKNLRKLNKTG
jgi:tetratricopeptide (TPR) repeat protein